MWTRFFPSRNARDPVPPLVGRILLATVLLWLLPDIVRAATGGISGVVIDATDGGPMAEANVTVPGTGRGAASNARGMFTIENLSPGVYTVRVSYIGFQDAVREGVFVEGGRMAHLEVAMEPSPLLLDPVLVQPPPSLRPEATSQSRDRLSVEQTESLPIDDPIEMVQLLTGVVAVGKELSVQGMRPGQNDFQLDGISMKDPLVGRAGVIGRAAISEIEVVTGGMDAKTGDVLSSVISYSTREGGERVSGTIEYQTDDFGAPDKSYTNFDRILAGIGGPLPVPRMTYYVSAQGTWSDGYPATAEQRHHRRVLDFISVGDRRLNDVRLQGKLAWTVSTPIKTTFEVISSRSLTNDYFHNWTWDGYVRAYADTLDGGRTVTRRGPWASSRIDPSYEYYNAAGHTPDRDERFSMIKLGLNHTLGERTFYSLRLARTRFMTRISVMNKDPWQYDIASVQDLYFDYENGDQSAFYVRGGDFPFWSEQDTYTTTLRGDLTHQMRQHRIELGAQARYNDFSVNSVSAMYLGRDSDREIGIRDRYHYYQPEGWLYLQDRWSHEGMVLNVGARMDVHSVGSQVDPAEIASRLEARWSPRVGVAYPVTDRDVFSFHYGRHHQYPDRNRLYDSRGELAGGTQGNPDLGSEQTSAYQAVVEHLFSETVRARCAVYFRDIFGLVATRYRNVPSSPTPVPRYENRDYGSSRGFELTLTRAFANGVTGEVSYSYNVATGSASDPDGGNEALYRYLPLSEQPLDWDQRHSFKTYFTLLDPGGRWRVSATWQIASGRPFTPVERDSRDLEPEVVNSRRLPGTGRLDLQAEKIYQVWGRRFRAFVRIDNALDNRNIVELAPVVPYPAPGFDPSEYVTYYLETGHAGGGYIGPDLDGDGVEDWIALNDPSVFEEGRSVRLGLAMNF